MTQQTFSPEQICRLFNCTREQLRAQFAKNAAELRTMHARAVQTGKKVNGYTAAQLADMVKVTEERAKA